MNDQPDDHQPRTQAPTPRRPGGAWVGGALAVCVLVATGCATVQKTSPNRQVRVRNEGYSLLYQLLSQESDAAKLLIVKHADLPIADLIQEIASAAGQAQKTLEKFRDSDPRLNFKMLNLPEVEQQTRAAIESTETKALLFSSGKKFEVRFLFTQAQALNYAAHLAQVLHDQEDTPARKEFLDTLAVRCTKLHDRVMTLLRY